jgi:hypothetical protein
VSLVLIGACAGCLGEPAVPALELRPHRNTTEVVIVGPPAIGEMRLWVPEAIVSNTGLSAAYPVGDAWRCDGPEFTHHVEGEGLIGPGNMHRVDDKTVECVGIRFPLDSPVRWDTTVTAGVDSVTFRIDLTNVGNETLHKAGAAICLKFFHGEWWRDEGVYVHTADGPRTLAELGRDAGEDNGFQAYLLEGASFDNVFYQRFWGFNRQRLDRPVMISEQSEAGVCVGITAERAYFLHSNPGNPCTDVMMAFGDVRPGKTASATGSVWIKRGVGLRLVSRSRG